jgi:hypothetical protein
MLAVTIVAFAATGAALWFVGSGDPTHHVDEVRDGREGKTSDASGGLADRPGGGERSRKAYELRP